MTNTTNFDLFDQELLNAPVGATVTDGTYRATLQTINPVDTQYTVEEVIAGTKQIVNKQGKVYNFVWKLADGRTITDSRFTRDSDDPARKYQSINIAVGNIATQLGRTTLTLKDLLTEKPEIDIWVSRVGKNRNIDYLKPLPRTAPGIALAQLSSAEAPL